MPVAGLSQTGGGTEGGGGREGRMGEGESVGEGRFVIRRSVCARARARHSPRKKARAEGANVDMQRRAKGYESYGRRARYKVSVATVHTRVITLPGLKRKPRSQTSSKVRRARDNITKF